jgi:hypothetical protein
VGRPGGAVVGRGTRVARDLTGADRASTAWRRVSWVCGIRNGRVTGPRRRPVRVRLARARQPRPGIPWRDQGLAARVSRRDVGRRAVLR